MPLFRLTYKLYIAPQISRNDVAEAAKLGITTVICNRPDQEEPGQPSFSETAAWFSEAGITNVQHQPVTTPQITANDAKIFAQQIEASEGPVLAYCRTGTRCSLLWAISQIEQGRNPVEMIDIVQSTIGLDLNGFAAKLQSH